VHTAKLCYRRGDGFVILSVPEHRPALHHPKDQGSSCHRVMVVGYRQVYLQQGSLGKVQPLVW